ncbi:hypothetical protein EUX98_g3112 [Antrodiella citrinella]|uniref:Uncharacterized protein n=1 Tax=Antrodiella citrinella TaxID=2447956 RepID=A0A4S4MXD6_9APHY|nr:hypothetical protein EUX98_g3112 [Antrodiella citrinella]
MHIIRDLGCVLTSHSNVPIQVLHRSFLDYLSSPHSEDRKWLIDSALHRRRIGIHCLHLVAQHISARISDSGSPRVLPTEAHQRFPGDIHHAYTFWIEYLCSASYDADTFKDVTVANDIATMLMPVAFTNWCIVADVLRTRYKVLELSYTLLAWITDNLPQFFELDFRISPYAIRTAIDQVFDFIDSPTPGAPHTSHGSVVDSAPPAISISSPDVTLIEEETEEAVIVPLPELPWHLTQPYKMLKDLRKLQITLVSGTGSPLL